MNAQSPIHSPADNPARPPFSELDYSESALVAGLMADTLRKTDPATFAHCADALDCSPAAHLRGLAYLVDMLGQDQDAPTRQRSLAASAIADHLGLIAVWLDMQTDAASDRQRNDRNSAEGAA